MWKVSALKPKGHPVETSHHFSICLQWFLKFLGQWSTIVWWLTIVWHSAQKCLNSVPNLMHEGSPGSLIWWVYWKVGFDSQFTMHNVHIGQFFFLSTERGGTYCPTPKFLIFPKIYPCSNYKTFPNVPLLFPVSNGDSHLATTFPRSNYRGFLTTGIPRISTKIQFCRNFKCKNKLAKLGDTLAISNMKQAITGWPTDWQGKEMLSHLKMTNMRFMSSKFPTKCHV